jgi:hypothetical protein
MPIAYHCNLDTFCRDKKEEDLLKTFQNLEKVCKSNYFVKKSFLNLLQVALFYDQVTINIYTLVTYSFG